MAKYSHEVRIKVVTEIEKGISPLRMVLIEFQLGDCLSLKNTLPSSPSTTKFWPS